MLLLLSVSVTTSERVDVDLRRGFSVGGGS
jgi:hypothetical protein